MFDSLVNNLTIFANSVPIELFVFLGSILEEIIAPIPSPFVMTTAGTLLSAQSFPVSYIFVIALIAALGKTLGCIIFYFLADKAEDVVIKRYGKYLGFSHTQVESIGKHFNGTITDDLLIIFLRALPIMPSTPISLVAGFVKLNFRTFVQASLIGNYIRSIIFLFIGYEGLDALTNGIDSLESVVKIVVVLALGGLLAFVYYKRGRGNLHEELKKRLKL